MDYAGPEATQRSEYIARQVAAENHQAYYAHPALHLHSYGVHDHDQVTGPDVGNTTTGVGPINLPYQEIQMGQQAAAGVAPTSAQWGEKTGLNEEKKDEQGGMEYSSPATGIDKGAREYGGEAGGTHTSPGPSAALVGAAVQAVHTNGANGVAVSGALPLPDDRRPIGNNWTPAQAMEPHLQLMCGPLLSYYTIMNNIWHGAIMVVTADEGSVFNPPPVVDLSFHQYMPHSAAAAANGAAPMLLEPVTVPAQRILVHQDMHGPCSFWRFMIDIPVQECEMAVRYRLNRGAELEFVVPAYGQNLHWAAHSCNGFSSGVNPDEFKGDYPSGYDPVWEDLLLKHQHKPFHCMVGGGDQIYCDALTREPEMQSWINAPDRKSKLEHPVTDEFKAGLDRFYFNHYCKIFRSNAFARANSTVPMVNMLDDHDIIDGFGTYDDETQASPLFSYIGTRGYFWFLIFQLFINDDFDGIQHPFGQHPCKSVIIGSPGAWIPFWSHSLSVYLGPKVHMIALDCRAERKLHQIVTQGTYRKIISIIQALPDEVEHLVMLLGVPIAYPRMSFLEHFLGFKYNPINILARHNALGLGGMSNKFNKASELLDDLNDHWCANVHKKERNWLVLEMQRIALTQKLRITFLSGDVHLAAVGMLFSKRHKVRPSIDPPSDHRYMLNIVSSAIVNTPPPAAAAAMVNKLGGHKHRTLHKLDTDEGMLPVFERDTDGSLTNRPLAMPRRNYCIVDYDAESRDLWFDLRVEKKQGAGETASYMVKSPAPMWDRQTSGPISELEH